MIRRYGKNFDINRLKRNIDEIKRLNKKNEIYAKSEVTSFDNNQKYPCRICGSQEYTLFINKYGFQYCECEKCGAVYLANLPDIKKLYDEVDEKSTYSDTFFNEELYKKRVEMIAKPKVEFILECLDHKMESSENVWLDIGCGVGEVLSYVNTKSNWKVKGIEANKGEIAFAKQMGIENITQGFLECNIDNEIINALLKDANVISLLNIIEHIENPNQMISYISKLMRKGSYLIIEVPRHPSLSSFVSMAFPHFNYRQIAPPQHLQIFTEKSLEFMLKNNFEFIAQWKFGQGYLDILSGAMLECETNEAMKNLYVNLIEIANDVQKTIDEKDFSDVILLVARKIKD